MRITLRRTMIASASVTALLLMTATAPAQSAQVPFIDTFESGTLGVPWSWTTDDGGSAEIQTTATIEGSKAAQTTLADLTLNVAGDPNNVWCQLYAKPTLHANDADVASPPADVSAAFYVQSNGAVMVWSDAGPWTQQGTVPTGGWLAFAVHSDYASETWNLYVSDDGDYGTAYRRLNGGTPLVFNSTFGPASGLTAVTIGGVATIDAVALGKGVRLPAATGGSKVVVEALTLAPGASTPVNLMTAQYADSNERTIQAGTALGNDLLAWMQHGDAVTVRDTIDESFVYVTDHWEPTPGKDILPGMGAWIQRSSGGPLVMFMDYDALTYPPTGVDVYGTDAAQGFTFLTWGKDAMSAPLGGPAGNSGGFQNVARVKDNLYLLIDGQPRRLFWDGTTETGLWRDSRTGGAPAQQRLGPGVEFWYYRGSAAGNGEWNPGTAQ